MRQHATGAAFALALLVVFGTHSFGSVSAGRSEDRECERLATTGLLQEAGIDIGREATAVLTGCQVAQDGTWFYPTDSSDPRLPNGPILTPQEVRSVAGIRRIILDQLSFFPGTLIDWMQVNLSELERKAMGPDGRPKPGIGVDLAGTGSWIDSYIQALIVYLQNPNHEELDRYAAWWFERRQAAAPVAVLQNQPSPVAAATRNMLKLDRAPWPWDLSDPVLLDEFLSWALDRGMIQAPVSNGTESASTSPSSTDCTIQLGAWMGLTRQRIETVQGFVTNAPVAILEGDAEDYFNHSSVETRALIEEQAAIVPPPGATGVNPIVINAFTLYATYFETMGDAAATGYSSWVRVANDTMSAANDRMREALQLLDAIEVACGP